MSDEEPTIEELNARLEALTSMVLQLIGTYNGYVQRTDLSINALLKGGVATTEAMDEVRATLDLPPVEVELSPDEMAVLFPDEHPGVPLPGEERMN